MKAKTAAAVKPAGEPELDAGRAAPSAAAMQFTPLAYIVGCDADTQRLLMAAMDEVGIEHAEFGDSAAMALGWQRRMPDLVFVNVSAGGVDAVDALFALVERSFNGKLQLISDPGISAVESIERIAHHNPLKLLPTLPRPLDAEAIKALLKDQKTAALLDGPSQITLDEAIKNGWLDFWYQPKVDLRAKNLVGVESLVRLHHPKIGLVPPSVFLKSADETSLFVLSQQALVHAVKTATNFAKMGVNLKVAINISMKALRALPVDRLIRQYSGDRRPNLLFDVAQEDVAANLSFVYQRSKALRELGVRLAIDDYQSGQLTQAELKDLAITEIKIGRMFVAGCDRGSIEAAICQSVVDVARKLGTRTVGVGIERASQAEALLQMGCDVGQGFYFGHSVPHDKIAQLMQQRAAPVSE
jgi:EAL domain-containing protein (putative c-di-GMP-specific phosphodiesterase class I)